MTLKNFADLFGSDYAMLIGASDYYEYNGRERGLRLGTAYRLVNLSSCTIQVIRITDSASAISQDEIDMANALLRPLVVTVSGFSAKLYSTRDSGEVKATCTADDISVVDREDI